MSSLSTTLLRSARAIAGANLTPYAKSLAPAHLKAGISSHVTEESEGVIRITLTSKGADARAQEYGSGLQDRRNPRKYTIAPKNGQYLAFHWEVHPDHANYLPDGRILLPSVQHPGIHAVNEGKGYVRPALEKFRYEIHAACVVSPSAIVTSK